MTELGQMIWDDALAQGQAQGLAKGLAQGQAQGQQQASERYSKLILILDKEKKNDLIIKVASDPDFAKNYTANMAFSFGQKKAQPLHVLRLSFGERKKPKRLYITQNPHTKDNRRETYFLSE